MSEQTQTDASAGADWGEALAEQAAGGESQQQAGGEASPGESAGQAPSGSASAPASETPAAAPERPGSAAGDKVRRATLPDLEGESAVAEDDSNLRMILDIPVTVSMEIGRTRLPIRTLLQLNQGSVVELERLVGEPLDVLVNGTLIAHGEVVVINEKYGIRLTDVVSPDERVRKLR